MPDEKRAVRPGLFLTLEGVEGAGKSTLADALVERLEGAGHTVICDRFLDASTAYQGAGRRLGLEKVRELNHLATGGRRPDLTLLLDLDPATGRGRQRHVPDRMEQEDLDFHRRVRDGYLRLAALEPERFAVLDASRPAGAVLDAAWSELSRRWPDRL